MENGMIVCDTPDKIEAFRLLALKGALKMETFGMKGRFNVAQQVRTILGVTTRSKKHLLEQYELWLRENGYLQ